MIEMEEGEEDAKEAREQRDSYAAAVSEKFGSLAPFEELVGDLDALNSEFQTFVDSNIA